MSQMQQTSAHTTAILICFALFSGLLPHHCLAQTTDESKSAPQLSEETVFDREHLLEVKVEIADEDWDALRTQSRNFATALLKPPPPSPYTWFKADVTINGQQIKNVGVRKKGFLGSQDTERPSLKIKFDEFTEQNPIEGVDRLTLNNNKQDRGLVSQALAYKLFAEAGLPASRSTLAKVWVNGELLGIYTNVESVKKPMLVRNFGDSNGKLYEGTVADLSVDNLNALEAKIVGENDQRDELRAVAELIAGKDDVDIEALEKRLDVDEFLKFWAMESLIGFWDGYTNNQNNYFVYYHAADSKLHFMPWGTDAALSDQSESAMFKPGSHSVHGKSVLANRLYNTNGIAERYRETMLGLLEEVWDEDAIIEEIDRIEKLVDGHIHYSQEDHEKAMDQSRKFVRSRRGKIEREMKKWPQRIQKKPRKPFYTAKVGTGIGKFTTEWVAKDPEKPYEIGEGELELTIDGEVVAFTKLGVHAMRSKDKGMDGKKAPTIVFTGKRESNKIRVTFTVGTDEAAFEAASGEPVAAMGVMLQGAWFRRDFRMLGGTVTLEETGTNAGDKVRGTLNVDVVQFKGDTR